LLYANAHLIILGAAGHMILTPVNQLMCVCAFVCVCVCVCVCARVSFPPTKGWI
jgi:hypothetical protein